MMREVSVYSFKDGMETLTKALEGSLLYSSNVTVIKNTRITGLKILDDRSLEISYSQGEALKASHVVSALPFPVLHNLLSVHVVNLVFPSPPKDVHPEGFGDLIPRPPDGYPGGPNATSQGVLGTIFDSCFLHEQDLPLTNDYYNKLLNKASHTKLTMMTGGPYPKLPPPLNLSSPENEAMPPFIRSLLHQLKVHLGRDLPGPVYWRIWNNEACIPTLLPGHLQRMAELKDVLGPSSESQAPGSNLSQWESRLAVVGAGVGGVCVGDCIESGRQVGRDWAQWPHNLDARQLPGS